MPSILFEDIDLVNAQGVHIPHAYVGVRNGCIDYVGTQAPNSVHAKDACEVLNKETQPETRIGVVSGEVYGQEGELLTDDASVRRDAYDEHYDGRGKILMPGLYNAHSHVPMTLLRGRGEGLPLDRWLNEAIFPFEALISDEAAYYATILGIAEMARFGVVSCSDMYYHSDARIKAVLETGFKCNVGHSVLCFDPEKCYEDLPEAQLNRRLVADYHGAGNNRVLIDYNLHAEYTSTEKVVRGLAEAAQADGVRMQVHVSETASEVQACKERHDGKTPVAYLADCGLFEVPTTAAHCVWLEGNDVELLAEKGVFVATNPASNAKLGSGIADVLRLREVGVTVALGTDGVASNNNQNMFADMYLLALLQRAMQHTPVGLTPADVVSIATRNGALSQGRNDCGDIAVGMRADLIVLDADTPWMQPLSDAVSNVVYAAQGSDVVLTMIDGTVVYRDGKYCTLDVQRALFEVRAACDAIKAQL